MIILIFFVKYVLISLESLVGRIDNIEVYGYNL